VASYSKQRFALRFLLEKLCTNSHILTFYIWTISNSDRAALYIFCLLREVHNKAIASLGTVTRNLCRLGGLCRRNFVASFTSAHSALYCLSFEKSGSQSAAHSLKINSSHLHSRDEALPLVNHVFARTIILCIIAHINRPDGQVESN